MLGDPQVLRYAGTRAAQSVVTLLLLTVLAFLVIRAMPGDATLVLMEQSGSYTSDQLARIRAAFDLDQPVPVQYMTWLRHAAEGDFGYSFYSDRPAARDLLDRLPPTAELALLAMLIGGIAGLGLGVLAALKRGTAGDYGARAVAVAGICIPEFWLATLAIVIPAFWFHWSPPVTYVPINESVVTNLALLLPAALVASFHLAAVIARISRTAMLEVLTADYVRTAHAKGLPRAVVITRHALRNALLPVTTTLGLQLATLLGGAVVIETIFNIPGVGRQTLLAIQHRDYPEIQLNILFFGAIVMLANILVDILNGLLDPRISHS